MEVDTGSAVSIVSEVEYKKLFKHLKLQPTQFHLKTYSGENTINLWKSQHSYFGECHERSVN